MIEKPAVAGPQKVLRLQLSDHLTQTFGNGNLATLQSAVALLRTVFENHCTDPEHQSCLFFHGCTISGGPGQTFDFSVTHRSGHVVLGDFTKPWTGPATITLTLEAYTSAVALFADNVLTNGLTAGQLPEWQMQHALTCRAQLVELTALVHRFLDEGCTSYDMYCIEYQDRHGHLKRPLELFVTDVIEAADPFQPITVQARTIFGPIRSGEILPMRLNHGDVILVTAMNFTEKGILLLLEGVGSGGVRPGDRLFGLQMFYP